jgi:hypothetical protein
MTRIFVSIVSFCDALMPYTVNEAYAKVSDPNRLVFSVIDQHPESRRKLLESFIPPSQLRYVHVDPVESRGVCWARALAGAMYGGEPWYLQIDSHMYFDGDWDVALIYTYDLISSQGYKPILSTYPYGFEISDTGEIILSEYVSTMHENVLVLRPKEDQTLTEDSAVLEFQADFIPSSVPLQGCHVGAGFLFSRGNLVQEVPYDPRLYFHGEEQNISIRAWTRGWDIFHPVYIPIYHLYKQPNSDYLNHHWHPYWDKQRAITQVEFTDAAAKRLTDLFYRRETMGVYGLGTVRSLEDYARFSGIDYINRVVQREYREPGKYNRSVT